MPAPLPVDRAALLGRLSTEDLSLADAATQLGVTEARALELLDVYTLTRELTATAPRNHRRTLALVASASLVLGAAGATAASTACPNGYLYCFGPGTPARSGEVNYNFSQIKEWVETKVGGVSTGAAGTGAITSGSLTTGAITATSVATGNVTVSPAASVSFGSGTRQMLNLYGTGYGMGVQSSTTYFRSSGGYAWYLNGAHSNNQNDSGGGSTLMGLSSSGDLSLPSNSWGASGDTSDFNGGASFGNVNGLTLTSCPQGRYVCGLLMGHVGNSDWWNGTRIVLRCCEL